MVAEVSGEVEEEEVELELVEENRSAMSSLALLHSQSSFFRHLRR